MNKIRNLTLAASIVSVVLSVGAQANDTAVDTSRTNKHKHNYSQLMNQPQSDHSNVVVPYLPFPVVETLNSTQKAFDHSKPQDNTLVVDYNELATIKVRLREMMTTIVSFPKNEVISHYKLGDTTEFNVRPFGANGRTLGIDPVTPGTDTSFHVFGESGNVYTFYLRTDTVKSVENPHLRVIVRDASLFSEEELAEKAKKHENNHNGFVAITPLQATPTEDTAIDECIETESNDETGEHCISNNSELDNDTSETQSSEDADKETPTALKVTEEDNDYLETAEPQDWNFEYEIVGSSDKPWYKTLFSKESSMNSENIRPTYVYDDGVFTYFKFGSAGETAEITNLPTVFRVADGNDVPVQAMAKGSTLRLSSVSNGWTLRLGGFASLY